jgi:hypothetical protein
VLWRVDPQIVHPANLQSYFYLTQRRGEAEKSSFLQTVHDSKYAALHQGFTKVEQISQLASFQTQIGVKLLLMGIRDLFDGFQLHDDFALKHQIGPKAFFETDSFALNRYRDLSLHLQAPLSELMSQYNPIQGLQETGTQLSMHPDGRIHNHRPDFNFFHLVFSAPLRLCAR